MGELGEYTKDFQIRLLCHLAKDKDYFKEVSGYLRANDFDLNVCAFLYEAFQMYFSQFGSMPTAQSLVVHVIDTIQRNKANTVVTQEQLQALHDVMDHILHTLNSPMSAEDIKSNRDYFSQHLFDYLKRIRMSKLVSTHQHNLMSGGNIDSMLTEFSNIQSDLARSQGFDFDSIMGNLEAPTSNNSNLIPISTGIVGLDNQIHGGLRPTNYGVVAACPGVGKTTTLLNFAAAATVLGIRSLFVTLELTKTRIKHRFQAIFSGIDARYLMYPMELWPDDIATRYKILGDPSLNPFIDYATIVDASTRSYTILEIDAMITQWKQHITQRFGKVDASNPALVCVDWLDYISPVNFGKNKEDWEKNTHISKALSELARKHEVALWSATQATRKAIGVEKLNMDHVAAGFGKSYAMDIGLGVAPRIELATDSSDDRDITGQRTTPLGNDYSQVVDDKTKKLDLSKLGESCNRQLVISITKNRDSHMQTLVNVFQGKSLQFFGNEEEARRRYTTIEAEQNAKVFSLKRSNV